MTKRMLIDATHAEETRVVVLDGNRLEDFDVETAAKQQLKGNIYLAKVVRVEPSLQAAFVEYGGGRHGFLAFGEIHPDYYQIPVADRQRLLELQEAEARAEEEAEDAAAEAAEASGGEPQGAPPEPAPLQDAGGSVPESFSGDEPLLPLEEATAPASLAAAITQDFIAGREEEVTAEPASGHETIMVEDAAREAEPAPAPQDEPEPAAEAETGTSAEAELTAPLDDTGDLVEAQAEAAPTAEAGTAAAEHDEEGSSSSQGARPPARYMRSYKIQEVIRRRQILLVQVVKEERGSKGAALTTFISLAGRFSVLMPNSPRGGGISRKITSAADRRRLKEVTTELKIPRGMGLIVRTAGANRPKAEITRDCEYLLELWDSVRDTTMASVAPALIHEEASLIKRAIRDNYSRDVEEVAVDGEAGWRAARDFMRLLMPAHARKVVLWNEPQPLFAKHGVEAQLDAMLQPNVQLRSGGYLVINQTEALVAIDVNSGRSTRERGIEETALKTNLEAADEVARQLRLRDLAGLIVIDFIDMESRRNNAAVEKRIKDALHGDRARIQLGSISSFGLMELSRQRLRPSLAETSFTPCPHCGGTGHIRSTEMAALAVLRAVEEEGAKRRSAAIVVHVAGAVALYVLNHKRVRLAEIEARYGMEVAFAADESLLPPDTRIERVRAQSADAPAAPAYIPIAAPVPEEDELAMEEADTAPEPEDEEPEAVAAGEAPEQEGGQQPKRRRRRRGAPREERAPAAAPDGADLADAEQPEVGIAAEAAQPELPGEAAPLDAAAEEEAKGRRRGRRGGRRRRRDPAEGEAPEAGEATGEADAQAASFEQAAPAAPAYSPAYSYDGPTPANPFGGQEFDIFAIMDEPDVVQAAPAPASPEPPPLAVPDRPATEAEAAEATVPATEPPKPAPEPQAEPELALEAMPAMVEEEPPLLNGHAPPQEPEPSTVAEPVSAPVPPPILVGDGEPGPEKKRGWWRR